MNCHFAVRRSHNNTGTIGGSVLNTNVWCFFFRFLSNSGALRWIGSSKIKRKKKNKTRRNQSIWSVSSFRFYYINIIMSIFFPVVSFSRSQNSFMFVRLLDNSCLPERGDFAYDCTHDCRLSYSASHFIYESSQTHSHTQAYSTSHSEDIKEFLDISFRLGRCDEQHKRNRWYSIFFFVPESRRNNNSKEMCCCLKGNLSGWMLCAAAHLFVVFGFVINSCGREHGNAQYNYFFRRQMHVNEFYHVYVRRTLFFFCMKLLNDRTGKMHFFIWTCAFHTHCGVWSITTFVHKSSGYRAYVKSEETKCENDTWFCEYGC